MSSDRELSTFWDLGGGAPIAWHEDRWTVALKVEGYDYRFLDYAFVDGRAALLTDFGTEYKW